MYSMNKGSLYKIFEINPNMYCHCDGYELLIYLLLCSDFGDM